MSNTTVFLSVLLIISLSANAIGLGCWLNSDSFKLYALDVSVLGQRILLRKKQIESSAKNEDRIELNDLILLSEKLEKLKPYRSCDQFQLTKQEYEDLLRNYPIIKNYLGAE